MNMNEPKRTNARGHDIPISQISKVDLLVDDVVLEIAPKWLQMRTSLAEFKIWVFETVMAAVELINSEHGVKRGGKRGNIQFVAFDGSYKLLIAVASIIQFGAEIQAARELMAECISEWSNGISPELETIINAAFATDGGGGVSISKIMALRNYNIEHPTWKRAMEALTSAEKIVGSKQYCRFYVRNDAGKYINLALDIATV